MYEDLSPFQAMGKIVQEATFGLMAVQVDTIANCGKESAITAVKSIALGKYGSKEITAELTYDIVREAIEMF